MLLTSTQCCTCVLALAFLIASIVFPFTAYGTGVTSASGAIQTFVSTLNSQQRTTYERVVKHRRNLYMQGLVVGLVLASIIVGYMRVVKNVATTLCGCTAVVIVFVTTCVYYILSPKPVYMVEILTTAEQRKAWVDVYRGMQVNMYGSFIGALIASFVFFAFLPSGGVC